MAGRPPMDNSRDKQYRVRLNGEEDEMLAFCISREAGSTFISMEEKMDVGCVVLNRQLQGGISKQLIDPSIEDIINESNNSQYPYSTD